MLLVTCLCLFACFCCRHQGFAGVVHALLLSGLCRCLNLFVHAALAIGALQVLVMTGLCLFA